MGHIYSSSIPILYAGNILIISSLIFTIFTIFTIFIKSNKSLSVSKDFGYFIFLLIYFSFIGISNNDFNFIKYYAYVFILFFVLDSFFIDKRIFLLFIKIIVYTFIFMFILYIIASISSDFVKYFQVINLEYYPSLMLANFEHRPNLSILLYILTYSEGFNVGNVSILGLPRFYGFSREPTLYSMFVLPTIFMSIYLKKKFYTYTLIFALFLTSSFGALISFLVSLPFLFLSRKGCKYYIIAGFISIIGIYLLVNKYMPALQMLDIPRISSYAESFSEYSFNNIIKIIPNILLFYYVVAKIYKIKNQKFNVALAFGISSLLISGKGGEVLSPLLIFYISFIFFMFKEYNSNSLKYSNNRDK